MAATAGVVAAQPGFVAARGPQGIYANFQLDTAVKQAETAAYAGGSPAYPNSVADAILVAYFTTLLNDPAISGLAPQIPWNLPNPNDPGFDPFHPVAGAYLWNPLDDVFIAVDQWNRSHHTATPKTIQIILSAGFNAPGWVFSNIDTSVCGDRRDCTGSCDGLFMLPAPAVSARCGYTTLFLKVEGGAIAQSPFPLPWNSVYKSDWQTFLAVLSQRIQQEPSIPAFVSISIAGPTASSAEMILPSPKDQNPYTCGAGQLSLMETFTGPADNPSPVCPLTNPGFDVPTAWNLLFQNYYGPDPRYQNSDLAIIEEWDAAIDAYSQIFSGVTLVLTTTTDGLPTFPAADSSLLVPAAGFGSDCDDATTGSNADPSDAMACAAVTQILAHFTNPFVAWNNAKATQESGMTASRDGTDLGTNGIKWLAATTSGGWTPLPGTPYRMSRILGGLQFSHSFSSTSNNDVQRAGCPTSPTVKTPTPCPNLTPAEGIENVLSISYFPGTAVGPFFCADPDFSADGCAPTSVAYGHWVYSDAPMNYLQIYDVDILYALGLSQCSMLQITGRIASPGVAAKPPDVSACEAQSPPDAPTVQAELNLASQKLLSIAEAATLH